MRFRQKLTIDEMDSIFVSRNIVDLREEDKSPFRLVQRDYLGFLDYSTATKIYNTDRMRELVDSYPDPEQRWAMISMPTPRTVFEYICAVNPMAEHMLNNLLEEWDQHMGRRPTPKELYHDFRSFCRYHEFREDEIPF